MYSIVRRSIARIQARALVFSSKYHSDHVATIGKAVDTNDAIYKVRTTVGVDIVTLCVVYCQSVHCSFQKVIPQKKYDSSCNSTALTVECRETCVAGKLRANDSDCQSVARQSRHCPAGRRSKSHRAPYFQRKTSAKRQNKQTSGSWVSSLL